ncbi:MULTISPECIES: MarR family winged helix-turn-helix transcriptional regulator [Actinomadura]|uniref:MarR family transcriptional regulator n=1 Tax=Actinomadura litoris TaxID=2678616 RepID=A0A7K1LAT6_9ACTN|nr:MULTISPECIES: MarR family winged helix-turn-helix transcriptional regulator [Actinomadura]MBT2213242.1 MarR family winged helix-turn-helix transcriptional regulator [Actinomadura sp. NEAU-AAG7]MUN41356.1 MarR family transcriptional regulator [Actinomadura litoris]
MDDDDAGGLPPRLLGITTYVLARVARVGRERMRQMMAEHDLGLWHFAVLAALDDSGPVSQRDLGARLRVDPSDLVEVAKRLEGAGLVRRDRDPADRRRYAVALTAAGRAELDAVTARAAGLDAALLAPLDAGDRAALERIVRVLLAHHDPPPAVPPSEGPGETVSRRGRAAPGRSGRAAAGS